MNKIAASLCTFFMMPFAWAQINLVEIEEMTGDASTGYYYDTLVKAFQGDPYGFDISKGVSLYYGKLFRPSFDPYAFTDERKNFEDALGAGRYGQAIRFGEQLRKEDPVDIGLLLKLLHSYVHERNEQLAELTKAQINVLYEAMLRSGDGSSRESAIEVIQVPDEYAMLALMNLQGVSRRSEMKTHSILDIWKVRPAKKGGKKVVFFEVLFKPDRKTAGQ